MSRSPGLICLRTRPRTHLEKPLFTPRSRPSADQDFTPPRLGNSEAAPASRDSSGWPDSNRRPLRPERSALTKLRYTPMSCVETVGFEPTTTLGANEVLSRAELRPRVPPGATVASRLPRGSCPGQRDGRQAAGSSRIPVATALHGTRYMWSLRESNS